VSKNHGEFGQIVTFYCDFPQLLYLPKISCPSKVGDGTIRKSRSGLLRAKLAKSGFSDEFQRDPKSISRRV
jgi:hypothetical protein